MTQGSRLGGGIMEYYCQQNQIQCKWNSHCNSSPPESYPGLSYINKVLLFPQASFQPGVGIHPFYPPVFRQFSVPFLSLPRSLFPVPLAERGARGAWQKPLEHLPGDSGLSCQQPHHRSSFCIVLEQVTLTGVALQ